MMSSGRLIELDITDLAFDGKAVGHLNGKVVFCDGGLPGERVLAEIIRSRPRYDQARLREILKPDQARIKPVCAHFDHCGGCTWQDLQYDQQLLYKKQQVTACIERIGNLSGVPVDDVIGSQEQYYYRNKMEFSFHTKAEGAFTLGLHRRGHFDEIFDLSHCFLESEQSNEIVALVRQFVKDEQIPVYDVIAHTGFIRFLVIREAKKTDQTLVNIVTNYGPLPSQERLVDSLTSSFPSVRTIVQNQTASKANVATGEVELVLYGPGYIEEELLGGRFRIRPNSFFQTNSRQAEVLYRTAFEMLGAAAQDRVLDLFCGTGSIGILLAPQVAEVVGVEMVPDAVAMARENASLNKIRNISFYHGDVKDLLRAQVVSSRTFDIVIVDPPRAGLHPKALKGLLELQPSKLLYISCNPATFSRDAGSLAGSGYRLDGIKPVDMFPQTKHVEVIGLFYRE